MSRLRGLVVLVACLVCVPAASAAGPHIAGADTSAYPRLFVNVVTPMPTKRAPGIRENGLRVRPVDTVNLGRAKSIAVVIDNSKSMAGDAMRDAAAAARSFVAAKSRADAVSVVTFGRHVVQLTSFSTSSAEADGVLRGLHVDAQQGTALYDAVVSAGRSLRSTPDTGRVIIVLTDGRDVSSAATVEEAVTAARRAHASVYPIGIASRDFDPSVLERLAADTGGTYHRAGSSVELTQIYAAIASELARTWRIAYDTTARPGDAIKLSAGADTHIFRMAGSSGASGSTGLPSAAYSPLGTLVLGLLAGALVLTAVFLIVSVGRGSWVAARVAPHVVEANPQGRRAQERLSLLKALFHATEGALGRRKQWHSIGRLLVRGDVPLRTAEFVWLSVGCGVVGGIVFAVAQVPPLLILVAMAVAGAVPYGFVMFRVRNRVKAFENQLPDLLTTIAASLKAGHSFRHGLQAVVDEGQPPASIELKRVLTEAGLGRPLDDALNDMAERVGSENFGFAITAVTIQRQVGGSLATLFDMVSDTVRNRQQFARKIKSLTAMGRMSAYTLVGIPFFIAGMVSLINPTYMSPLFHTQMGRVMLIGGLGMMAVGSVLLKKIVSFKG
jgi:tight adherence protein B